MKGVLYSAYGKTTDVLKFSDAIPLPKLETEHDVLVRVYAASINPADCKQMESGGTRYLMDRPLPVKPGFDFSGVVIEKGKDVTHVNVGDEVYGMVRGLRTGTTCEYVAVDDFVVSKKPKSISHAQAAGMPLAGLTAFQCLKASGLPFPPTAESVKKRVFVTGGAGGVGTYAIQMAKQMFGVGYVVTTASETKTQLCKDLGADRVIDYNKEKFWETLQTEEKFDACIDLSGDVSRMVSLLNPNDGGLVTIITAISKEMLLQWLNHGGPAPGFKIHDHIRMAVNWLPLDLFTGAWRIRHKLPGTAKYHSLITLPNRAELDLITPFLESQKVKTVVDQDKEFPLEQAVEAYLRSASGKAVGKVIVKVA